MHVPPWSRLCQAVWNYIGDTNRLENARAVE
jgi:hypothetical protein